MSVSTDPPEFRLSETTALLRLQTQNQPVPANQFHRVHWTCSEYQHGEYRTGEGSELFGHTAPSKQRQRYRAFNCLCPREYIGSYSSNGWWRFLFRFPNSKSPRLCMRDVRLIATHS